VDPAGAIQRYKLTAAMDWAKSFVMARGATPAGARQSRAGGAGKREAE